MADNATRYRSAYAQSRVDRLAEDWAYAERELFTSADLAEAKAKYLDAQIADERAYLRDLEALALETPKATSTKAATSKGDSGGDLMEQLKVLKDLRIAEAEESGKDATRVVDLMGVHDKSWSAPASSVSQLTQLADGYTGNAEISRSPTELAARITSDLQGDRFAGAVASLATEEQRRDAGIKLSQAIAARTGIDVVTSRQAVAQALGLAPTDLNEIAFIEEKAAARDDLQKKAYAGGRAGLRALADTLQADLSKRLGTEAVEPPSQDKLAARTRATAYVESDAYRMVKKALEDDGKLTEADKDITPAMVKEYEDIRRIVQRDDVPLAESDAAFFDDLFLKRLGAQGASRARLSKLEQERAGIDTAPVTVEEIRARTAEINAPHRSVSLREAASAQGKARAGQGELGKAEMDAKAGVPPTLTDQQRATRDASVAAIKLVRENPKWDAEDSPDMEVAKRIHGMLSQGLKANEVWGKVAELSAGDTERRDRIYARVLAHQVAKQDETRVEKPTPETKAPAPVKGGPPALEDVLRSGTGAAAERRKKLIDALMAIDTNNTGF